MTAWTFEPERGQHRRQLDNMGETGEEMKNGVICGSGKSAGENSACARNISLDALRVLCMFLIVFGHAMVHEHILETLSPNSANYYFVNGQRAFLSIHVNCFVLISAYFLCTRAFRLGKIVTTWG